MKKIFSRSISFINFLKFRVKLNRSMGETRLQRFILSDNKEGDNIPEYFKT